MFTASGRHFESSCRLFSWTGRRSMSWYHTWSVAFLGRIMSYSLPSGFSAPKRVNVASHGVLYSGWQPNPERTVMSAPWFRVECCTCWPADKESYENGLCGHRIHEGCILTLQHPYRMEACPVCCSHTTHFEWEGWFLYVYLYGVNAGDLVLDFHYVKGPVLKST